MTINEVLAKHNLTAEQVSHGLRTKIKRHAKIAEAIESAKAALTAAKTVKRQKEIEAEITRGEENLSALTGEIVAGVDNYVANYELNEKKKANLEAIRKKKAEKQAAAAAASEGSEGGEGGEGTSSEESKPEGAEAEATEQVVEAEATEEVVKKKSGNTVAIVLGVVGAVVLGFLGLKVFNRD